MKLIVLSLFSIVAISISIVIGVNVPVSPQRSLHSELESEKIPILHDGDPIPQLFKARVPVPGYSPGETVGFIVMDMDWQHPFWFTATVKDGYAHQDFTVGCLQDVGHTYRITGLRLQTNSVVPANGEMRSSVPGTTFYGPATHRRL